MIQDRRVVITGIGSLCSLGIGNKKILSGIIEGKTNVQREDYFIADQKLGYLYKHKVVDFDINNFGIDELRLQDINQWKEGDLDIDLHYLLAVIKMALDDASIDSISLERDAGIVVTHENPGLEAFLKNIFKSFFEVADSKGDWKNCDKMSLFHKLYDLLDKNAYDMQTFMFLYHAARTFNIHGFSIFINNACASGLFALESASQNIKSGKNKIVIVAGSDNPGFYKYMWLNEVGLCSKTGKIRPFAINRDGFIFGDGGAALVLEDFDYAVNRGAHIYAEYLGGSFSLESWKVTLPDVGGNSYFRTIASSLENVGLKPNDIDLVNAHGVATTIVDQYEALALTTLFGKNFGCPFVTALKPYIGHNLGGCALLEIAVLLVALENNFVPPVLGTEDVDPKLAIKIVKKGFYSDKIKTVMKTACGFGGYDGSIILRRGIK